MTDWYGWMGTILRVDLSSEKISEIKPNNRLKPVIILGRLFIAPAP